MKVLVIDVGGNNVKMLASGHKQPVKFPSGRSLTPEKMVAGVKKLAANWRYDVVSIGVPEPVLPGQLILDPQNLGPRDAAVNEITRSYQEFVNILEEAPQLVKEERKRSGVKVSYKGALRDAAPARTVKKMS